MRFRNLAIVAVALLAVAFIGRRVFLAIQHTFHKPPVGARAEKSTPNEQNLFALREIQPVNQQNSYDYTQQGPQKMGGSSGALEADIGLWIKMGAASQSLGSGCESAYNSPCAKQLSVTGQSSTGDTFPLPWKTMSDSSSPGASTPMLLAIIPAGYPDTYQWVDVSVDDRQGHKARWRITHLPPSQHVLAPPIALQNTFQQGNIKATARAYRGRPAYYPPGSPMLLYDIHGTITGGTHQWELGHIARTLEWEPVGYSPQDMGVTYGSQSTLQGIRFECVDQRISQSYGDQPTAYEKNQHFLRLSAQFQQFETYDEKITFHNLTIIKNRNANAFLASKELQTATTPSGITVTLPDFATQTSGNSNRYGGFGGDYMNCVLNFSPATAIASLPRSPLWQHYRRLIMVEVEAAKPFERAGSSSNGNGVRIYSFHLPPNHPKVIPNFTVIVRQRVDLQAVPMTFTLPIGASPRP